MDTVVDVVSTGESTMALKTDSTAPVDLLGRQEIVDRIMKILGVISEKKSSCTFALNGAWGTGKTFVLNMLMNQLWEYHSDKYIVFHYNCWQYDYYEEPLIAIVAAMLDSVDEENHLLPENLRDKAKAGMELAKPVLKKIATDFVKNKIGVDLTDVVSNANSFKEAVDSEEEKRAETRSFDEFYSFKKAIQQAQHEIKKLAKKRTLVVVVDELDRCLPSYAIKVLERLHHLFSEASNCVVIFAVDKTQLDNTISQTFGNNTDTTKYLRKFLDFEIDLDVGSISGSLFSKYNDFFSLFFERYTNNDFPVFDFLSALLSGTDMRTQERIFERVRIVHQMLFPNTHKSYEFMCAELMYAFFHDSFGKHFPFFYQERSYTGSRAGYKLTPDKQGSPFASLNQFIEKWLSTEYIGEGEYYNGNEMKRQLIGNGNSQKMIIYFLSHLYDDSKGKLVLIHPYNSSPHEYSYLVQSITELESFRLLYDVIH